MHHERCSDEEILEFTKILEDHYGLPEEQVAVLTRDCNAGVRKRWNCQYDWTV